MVSVCSPLPAALAAELSGRADAARVLDELRHETALVERTSRGDYRIHPLLRSYLVADLARHRPETYRDAARRPPPAGGRQRASRCTPCGTPSGPATADLVADAAAPVGRGPAARRRPRPAAARAGGRGHRRARGADPWLALTAAITHLDARALPAGRGRAAERPARRGPSAPDADLGALRASAELLAAGRGLPGWSFDPPGGEPSGCGPELAALLHASRGAAEFGDPAGADVGRARAELDRALAAGPGPRPRLPGGAEPVDAGRPWPRVRGDHAGHGRAPPSRPWPRRPATAAIPRPGPPARRGCSPTPTCSRGDPDGGGRTRGGGARHWATPAAGGGVHAARRARRRPRRPGRPRGRARRDAGGPGGVRRTGRRRRRCSPALAVLEHRVALLNGNLARRRRGRDVAGRAGSADRRDDAAQGLDRGGRGPARRRPAHAGARCARRDAPVASARHRRWRPTCSTPRQRCRRATRRPARAALEPALPRRSGHRRRPAVRARRAAAPRSCWTPGRPRDGRAPFAAPVAAARAAVARRPRRPAQRAGAGRPRAAALPAERRGRSPTSSPSRSTR